MSSRILTQKEINYAAGNLKYKISQDQGWDGDDPGEIKMFGIPKGGVPVVYLLQDAYFVATDDPNEADVFVDDLRDSGKTEDHWRRKYNKPFYTLANYLEKPKQKGEWLVFPWEVGQEDQSADDIVIRLLQYVGEDPHREGLQETPQRVLKAWTEWCSGYAQSASSVLKVFEDGSEGYDNMVMVKDIPFYSMCEHHLAPFFGTATIAYIPSKRVVGLSKLSRVLSIYARRLQVQERITVQVADALQTFLAPKGVGVLLKARHLCMESRGISQQGHETITSALRGEFLEDHKVRDEFLSIAK